MGIYGHAFDDILFENNVVFVNEGVKEVFNSIIESIKKFIRNIIDFIKKLLGLKPNDKIKGKLNDNLNSATAILKGADDIENPEEAKKIKAEADKIKSSTEQLEKEMESEAKYSDYYEVDDVEDVQDKYVFSMDNWRKDLEEMKDQKVKEYIGKTGGEKRANGLNDRVTRLKTTFGFDDANKLIDDFRKSVK